MANQSFEQVSSQQPQSSPFHFPVQNQDASDSLTSQQLADLREHINKAFAYNRKLAHDQQRMKAELAYIEQAKPHFMVIEEVSKQEHAQFKPTMERVIQSGKQLHSELKKAKTVETNFENAKQSNSKRADKRQKTTHTYHSNDDDEDKNHDVGKYLSDQAFGTKEDVSSFHQHM